MKHSKLTQIFFIPVFCMLLFLSLFTGCSDSVRYDRVIEKRGREPLAFFREKLSEYDLLICDDALHPALEPYEFLCDYIRQEPESIDLIFFEVMSLTSQQHIDAFLNSPDKDTLLLAKVFQQSYNYFWPYESYLDVFSTVWDVNRTLPEAERIRIIGVDQPIYWEGIHSRKDYNDFQASLVGRDYFMYKVILGHMDHFNAGKKGIFMTNTRHAYKCIRNKQGQPYWNTGTFFHEWHPGKTYALRFHNMILNISAVKETGENASTEGMERMEYSWARMDGGAWDAAFERQGNLPLALPLKHTLFGRHPYIGNHMLNARSGQTLLDAYDALIFLRPLDKTRFTAETDFFMTDDFKQEVGRRVRIIEGYRLETFLKEHACETVEDYVNKLCVYVPVSRNPLVNE